MRKRTLFLFVAAMIIVMVISLANIFAATSVKVQTFNGNTGASTNTIAVNFKLVNSGSDPITLSNVKMRYYFTNDGTQTNSFACDWASVNNTNVTGTFTTITPVTNADRYLEVGFSSGAGTLAAGAYAEVKVRVWKSDWSNFTQTNDYSFNASVSNYVDSMTVTAYISGTLYWGTPPDGGVATATPTIVINTPTPTRVVTPTPTVTVTPTQRVTVTPTRRATVTPTTRRGPTGTPTPTRRGTVTATPTVTQPVTPTATGTATPTVTRNVTVTPTNTATPTPTRRATPTPTTPVTTTGFVSRIGTRLVCNGKTFYFNGTNQYYLFYKSHAMVDEVLEDAAAMGLTIMRTWGFCDGKVLDGFCFQPSAGVYDEKTFQNFDYTIYKAGQLGIKLIIPLVNNWDDMGGMNQYVAWAGASSHDDFYTNATCRTTYKNYVKYFLNRVNSITGVAYKDDPTIAMWELGNEPRCGSDTTGAKLQTWIDEMAPYFKSIDSKHLLSTGEEGFYPVTGVGSDYIKNHQNPSIDVCSAHLYPGGWQISEAQALAWISDHANDAHNILGKPFYLGEFGWGADQTSSTAIAKRNQVYTDWYNMLNSTNSDGAMFWLLSSHQDDGTLYPDYDTFTVYYPENPTTNTVISNYSAVVAAKSGITFDNTPPSASITSPANNASVSGTVTIAGTATDNNALSKVEVSIDGGIYRPATGTASWSYSWDSTKLVNGTHTITVKATDVQLNTSTTTISVTTTGGSPAGVWTMTGYKSADGGYWFTHYLKALNASGAAQTGHFVFRFYIVPEGTMTIQGFYDNSTVYNSNVTAGSFTAYYGTTQYFELDMGTRTINAGDYVGYFGTFGQSDGKMITTNDWSSSELPTAYGPVTHIALYKDGVLVGGLNP